MVHQITDKDLRLEAFYREVANRPQRKFEDTLT
jgi:hypothetical protein